MGRKIIITAAVLAVFALGAAGFIALIGVQVGPDKDSLTGRWVADRDVAMNLNANHTFDASGFSRCAGPFYYIVPNPDRGPTPEDAITVDQAEGTWDYGPESEYADTKALVLRFRSPKEFTVYWNVSKVVWQFHTKTMSIIKAHDAGPMPGTTYCEFVAHG